jgi:hypothetical protein
MHVFLYYKLDAMEESDDPNVAFVEKMLAQMAPQRPMLLPNSSRLMMLMVKKCHYDDGATVKWNTRTSLVVSGYKKAPMMQTQYRQMLVVEG